MNAVCWVRVPASSRWVRVPRLFALGAPPLQRWGARRFKRSVAERTTTTQKPAQVCNRNHIEGTSRNAARPRRCAVSAHRCRRPPGMNETSPATCCQLTGSTLTRLLHPSYKLPNQPARQETNREHAQPVVQPRYDEEFPRAKAAIAGFGDGLHVHQPPGE